MNSREVAKLCAVLLFSLLSSVAQETIPLRVIVENAVAQSKLTQPGNSPFHLKAVIGEPTNPDSEYKGQVEEYWVSPEKWRRTIVSPAFSQTMVVNGDNILEESKGDYYPWWLKDLVTAFVDPIPMAEMLKQVNTTLPKPRGNEHSLSCARISTHDLGHLSFCFQSSRGLPESIFTPWFDAQYRDYKEFAGKHVAQRIAIAPEPGITIEAKITELSPLANPPDSLFAVESPTPFEQRMQVATLQEASARKLLQNSSDLKWPTVGGGLTKGRMAIYISTDRAGHVREAWPHGSDNADLLDFAREEVRKWRFKAVATSGALAQMETLLTFDFETTIDKAKAKPVLSEADARKLAIHVVEPNFPPDAPKGQDVVVKVSVNEDGRVAGVSNPNNLNGPIFIAALNAVRQWTFRPYMLNGRSAAYDCDMTFHIR